MYFLDTTFIVALFVSNDQWHQKAVEIFEKIKLDEFIISKLVIAETITVLKNKLNTKEIREIYRTLPKIVNVIDDYEFFDEDDVVFVYINNNLEPVNVPWSYYSEISEGLHDGVDVLTGEPFEVSDATVVAPKTALVVEFSR